MSLTMNNNRRKQLEELNIRFCRDAQELRWEVSPGVWTKRNMMGWNIDNIGWARSIKFREKNKYMFVMDIDGNGLNPALLNATYLLANELKDITGTEPLLKASGKSGAHISIPIKFPGTWGETRIFQTMKDLAYTTYLHSGVKDLGINIGRAEQKPYIDTHMYERGRLVRGMSLHMGSKRFAVPILLGDTLNTVNRRMLLLEDIPNVKINTLEWVGIELEHYEEKREYEKKSMDFAALTPDMISKLKHRTKGDRWYRLLPPQLKVICSMNVDVNHMLKVYLTQYLVYYFGMKPGEIHDWMVANVEWEDFVPNHPKALYHINYIYNWVKDKTIEDEYEALIEVPPIPRQFWEPNIEYEGVWKDEM